MPTSSDVSATSATLNRRRFLRHSLVLGVGVTTLNRLSSAQSVSGPSNTVRLAVVGLGRGSALVQAGLTIPGVEIAALCDVDQQRLQAAVKTVSDRGVRAPRAVTDFRQLLDDRTIDALVIATCNHWHAPAAIMACAAGKDVYVEKPGSHDPNEALMLMAAARKHARVVQLGTQRRTWPGVREGMQRLHEGAIGRLTFARAWYTSARPSMGRGREVPVPPHLNYDIWQGPAPARPYRDNVIHYNWHWLWHWGNGELGNNGPHYLDLIRWGLRVDYPKTVSYVGGRYHFADDQETPDTGTVLFDFGAAGASWEQSSCHPRKTETFNLVNFYGDGGTMTFDGGGYKIFDQAGKQTHQSQGPSGDASHLENFVRSVRERGRPNADIADGQKSTLLCHLGNIAYRTGRVLHVDPHREVMVEGNDAKRLWARHYRRGWEPKF